MSERKLFELWLGEYDGKSNVHSFRNQFIEHVLRRHIPSFEMNKIERGEHGKPLLPGSPVSFSLSHCGRDFALLVSGCDRCGIDIQKIVNREDYDEAYRSVFTDREYEILCLSGDEREFAKLWSLKEAFIKALGGSIWFGKDYDLYEPVGRDDTRWYGREGLQLCSFPLPSGKWVSLALPEKPERIEKKNFPKDLFSRENQDYS